MTKQKQTEIKKSLRDQGYRGRIEQRSNAWRITVSQIPPVQHPISYKWHRDPKGVLIKEESAPTFHDRSTSTAITASRLLSWFRENGWPCARVIRVGSGDIVFELDHKHNIWKTLQNL